ncbi:MAG: phosphodiester glycosidase family protein [Bacteroidota bacterium]
MRSYWYPLFLGPLLALLFCLNPPKSSHPPASFDLLEYTVDPSQEQLAFFWKDDQGQILHNHQKLRDWLARQDRELLFAMNGGMYKKDASPQGLYIENGRLITPLDTLQKGYGNFYLQPNGIFYLTDNGKGVVCQQTDFTLSDTIKYATQSGPMLVIDGQLHPAFRKASTSTHIRNGVGLLPNGKLLFAMSKEKVNFHTFASFFKDRGCQHALYLDGFVSRSYLPAQKWAQLDGRFGVIIAEVK